MHGNLLETHNRMMPEKESPERSVNSRAVFNRTTAQGEWLRRIARADQLVSQAVPAAEILKFYAVVARFQQYLFGTAERLLQETPATGERSDRIADPLPAEIIDRFPSFISLVERTATEALKEAAREISGQGKLFQAQLLDTFWKEDPISPLSLGPVDFFARAFLQPYAAAIRARTTLKWSGPAPFLCPMCKRKPGVAVLRPLGDGGQRSLICSFCLAEWEFRRIVCPGCGEEDHAKLPVYTAEELKHVRVESCDSCRLYVKSVDMTKNGLAEPVVDEIASVSLDIWAQSQGYTKLQTNFLQM